ncbi:MAG: glycyl-radical enzyme activating protein [Phycisphaerae bacterium]|nr:glycyl-radical enzyme activating protein [Phycisphaerae bacterium]
MVFDIQRFSIHDGPGIRTTVFLKGCPLRCLWCHNPEGISSGPVVSFLPERCVGCGHCVGACAGGAHVVRDGVHELLRERCVACGRCAAGCYAGALELIGKEMTTEAVLAEVLADAPFYANSGGGMTLSGGEPFHQPAFAMALLREAKRHRLHCCVETSGVVSAEVLLRAAECVDLFLYDIKDTNDVRHRANVGASNALPLANVRALVSRGAAVRLRVPLIPGYNDFADHLDGVAVLAGDLSRLSGGGLFEGVELMPFHKMGLGKIRRTGMVAPFGDTPPADPAASVRHWIDTLRARGVTVRNER